MSQCDCGICSLNRALKAKRLDRAKIARWADWMLEEWADEGAKLGLLLRTIHECKERGEQLPADLLRAQDAAAAHTIYAPDYDPPERYRVVAAPSFVEDYAKLTKQDKTTARKKLRERGVHLSYLEPVAVPEREETT